MRVAVIGAGIAGACTAFSLTRRGHEVVGFDQHLRGHCLGSSHGHSRIIRKTYPDRLHTGLMARAYDLWDDAQARAGTSWVECCGILFFGPLAHPDLIGLADALDHHRVPWERWEAGDASAQAGLLLRTGEVGIFQSDGGYVRASLAVDSLIAVSESQGAHWSFGCRIERIERTGTHGLTVHGPEVETRCDAVVVCAGPWVTRWWPEFHDRFTVTRQTWAYVGDNQTPGPRTAWIDAESLAYGFPRDCVVEGFKIARHVPGTKTSPEGVDRNWNESDRLDLGGIANDRLPDLGPLHSPGTCLYTNTPDGLFAIGKGHDPGVYVVSPCSGHGFKFGPLIGEWAADAVESGSWPAESAPFSIERFAG